MNNIPDPIIWLKAAVEILSAKSERRNCSTCADALSAWTEAALRAGPPDTVLILRRALCPGSGTAELAATIVRVVDQLRSGNDVVIDALISMHNALIASNRDRQRKLAA